MMMTTSDVSAFLLLLFLALVQLARSAPLPSAANDHVTFWNMVTSSSQERDPSFDLLTNSLHPRSSNNKPQRANRNKLPSSSWSRARKHHVITNRVPTSSQNDMTSPLLTSSSSSMQLGGNMIVLASVGFGKDHVLDFDLTSHLRHRAHLRRRLVARAEVTSSIAVSPLHRNHNIEVTTWLQYRHRGERKFIPGTAWMSSSAGTTASFDNNSKRRAQPRVLRHSYDVYRATAAGSSSRFDTGNNVVAPSAASSSSPAPIPLGEWRLPQQQMKLHVTCRKQGGSHQQVNCRRRGITLTHTPFLVITLLDGDDANATV